MRALLFSVSAVALVFLTTAPGPWHEGSSEERVPNADARLEHAPFLGPVAASEALGLRGPSAAADGATAPTAAAQEARGVPREFYFTRAAYSGGGRGFRRRQGWSTDYPKADQIFLSFIDRLLSNLDAYEREHPIRLDDPEVRRFPYLYALEVGGMYLTQPEIDGLRDYLLAGGFLVIDDFWGSREWANFEYQIQLVLPGYEIVDLPLDHPIFTTFYEIDEIMRGTQGEHERQELAGARDPIERARPQLALDGGEARGCRRWQQSPSFWWRGRSWGLDIGLLVRHRG